MILSVFCVSISASNIDGVLIEDVTLREENVKHFKNPDGSYTALVYTSPVHRKDSAGNWQDIDNRMDGDTVGDKQAYVTSDGRTVFSKKLSSDDSSIYTLSENGYSIKMSVSEEGLENTSAKLSNHASKYIPKAGGSLETQYKKVKEIDNTTTVTYKNAISGIDLEYQLSANDIKENIIVRKAQSEYAYTFIYELEGLEAELLDDGSVVFADEDTAEGIYRIPAPYMTDAEGARSEAVTYTLSETAEGVYSLTVTADASWINAEERELPVTIDPTVTMNDENVYITYINEYSPSSNYNGYGKISMAETTMFKIYNLPTLPGNAAIYDAYLSVNYSSGSSGTESIGLYRVYGFWTDYDVTWNDLYSVRGTLSLSSTAYASASWSLSSTSQSYSFDVNELVRNWYEGTEENYGIALRYLGDEGCEINVSAASTALSISYHPFPIAIPNGTYYVRNVEEDKYLQKDDDAGVGGINYELWAPDGSTGQRWNFRYIYNGYYLITSLDDNMTLERYTRTDGSTELLHMNYVENKHSQQWHVSVTDDGYFKISSKNSLSQYLTAEDAGTNDAATVGFNTAQTDNSDEWAIVSMMFPLSGYEVAYNPTWWNDDTYVELSNCYAYALNNRFTGKYISYINGQIIESRGLDIGLASSGEFFDSNLLVAGENGIPAENIDKILELVEDDAETLGFTFRPIGKYEQCSPGCYKVALVLDPYIGHGDSLDYHWYRQNSDGTWSHKPGSSSVTNLDASNDIIYDPQYADRRTIIDNICYANYSVFVGFFEVSPLNHTI